MKLRLLLLYLYAQLALGGMLSPQEQKMRDFVQQTKKQQIATLAKWVNQNSGTSNLNGVHKVGEMVRGELNALGFKTKWVEEPISMHRAGTLVAEREGTRGRRLLLIAHLDTVFPTDTPFKKFDLHSASAKGPGVADDKGGLVVLLYALKAMQAAHALDNATMTVVLTGDEEDSGKPAAISRKPLLAAAENKEVALEFEPTMTLNSASIARRGIGDWTITVTGNESHSATIFQQEVGAGAIFELARILNMLRIKFAEEQYLAFNPGIILGGTSVEYNRITAHGLVFGKSNIVAKIGLVKGDFRFLTKEQKDGFEKHLAEIAAQHLPGTKSTVTFTKGIPAMAPTKASQLLLQEFSAVSEDLGFGPVKEFDPGLRGAGDISYIADIVPAKLVGLGPVGYGTHSVIEAIELNSLPVQTLRAAVLMSRLVK